jgi:hypothetical protein
MPPPAAVQPPAVHKRPLLTLLIDVGENWDVPKPRRRSRNRLSRRLAPQSFDDPCSDKSNVLARAVASSATRQHALASASAGTPILCDFNAPLPSRPRQIADPAGSAAATQLPAGLARPAHWPAPLPVGTPPSDSSKACRARSPTDSVAANSSAIRHSIRPGPLLMIMIQLPVACRNSLLKSRAQAGRPRRTASKRLPPRRRPRPSR